MRQDATTPSPRWWELDRVMWRPVVLALLWLTMANGALMVIGWVWSVVT